MTNTTFANYTAFDGHTRIASGRLPEIGVAVRSALENGLSGPILTFDDATGRQVDINVGGTLEEMVERLRKKEQALAPQIETTPDPHDDGREAQRGRGRPKLGVVAREVTLLPRHWEWLNAQPGGASVALRKLVEEARRANGARDRRREAQENAYRFISAIGGDLPNFEELSRALFADDKSRFSIFLADLPQDIRDYAMRLAFPVETSTDE